MSKSAPVAPSAWNHVVDGAFTPADSWPPSQSVDVPKYIARSATPGWSKVTTMPKGFPCNTLVPVGSSTSAANTLVRDVGSRS